MNISAFQSNAFQHGAFQIIEEGGGDEALIRQPKPRKKAPEPPPPAKLVLPPAAIEPAGNVIPFPVKPYEPPAYMPNVDIVRAIQRNIEQVNEEQDLEALMVLL